MKSRHLSAMANIAAQMAVNGDHIEVWMFWRRFSLTTREEVYADNDTAEQYEELFLVGEDAINAARDWIEGYLCRDDGNHVVPSDMDLTLDTVVGINEWFSGQEYMRGGVILVALRL